ncbi:short-chain dehydrogenase [Cadophora sp. DSE1049]|nr:short-chain dehydrogenase [Cadophora sp. DSE1049]
MDTRCSSIIPHKPVLTEHSLSNQAGKVFIVTGGTGGIGKELVTILYQHNGKVYIAARSESKTKELIADLKQTYPNSTGDAIFLSLQLDDLPTIKASAEEFLSKEIRLDVLWNNAGVMVPPEGSKTKQGYELQLGINNLGHFLFTHFLTPLLKGTASTAAKDSVRVVWVSSSAADAAPHPAIDFNNMDYHIKEGLWTKYARSKAGNVIHSAEFARRTEGSGIVSIALNPGNFVTNLQQTMPRAQLAVFKLLTHDVKNGAYTNLFAGLDQSISSTNNGGYVAPFGKVEKGRKDFLDPQLGKQYWEWSEEQVQLYL